MEKKNALTAPEGMRRLLIQGEEYFIPRDTVISVEFKINSRYDVESDAQPYIVIRLSHQNIAVPQYKEIYNGRGDFLHHQFIGNENAFTFRFYLPPLRYVGKRNLNNYDVHERRKALVSKMRPIMVKSVMDALLTLDSDFTAALSRIKSGHRTVLPKQRSFAI